MKLVSNLAIAAILALGTATFAAPADAQGKKKQEQAEPAQKKLKLSKEERAAIIPVQTAVTAKDWAAANAALPVAQAAALSSDAKYGVGYLQLQIGVGLNDEKIQAEAIDNLIASGGIPAADLPNFYRNQAVLASKAGDKAKAEAAFTRLAELTPNDPEALTSLASVKSQLKKPQEALTLIRRAIELRTATGVKADESWYKYALKLAYENKLRTQTAQIGQELIRAYPTAENWRDALLTYRDVGAAGDKALQLDLLRTMRATKTLAGEADWYELAENLDNGGYPAEAKSVLEEGASLRMISLSKGGFNDLMKSSTARLAEDRASLASGEAKAMSAASGSVALKTADAFLGYKDYAKAVSFYRTALQKGGVDANLVNTRLGIALALAGQRTEAEAAFKAVTGPRADLASYWLLWLAQRS